MPFSNTWFEEQAMPLWEKYLLPLKDEVETYLEIGVAEGRSMLWVMENLEPKRAIGIDPYIPPKRKQAESTQRHKENIKKNLADWINKGCVHIIEETSWDFFTRHCDDESTAAYDFIKNNSIDLAYIDGAHEGWDCLADMVHVWPKLKRGGVMVIDDYHRRVHKGKALVRPAVNAFRLAYDNRWDVFFEARRQIAFRKIK